MYTEQGGYVTALAWKFSGYKYLIYRCTPGSPNYYNMSNVPTDINKTWTITKTSTTLIIKCNDVEIVNFVFDSANQDYFPECVKYLSQSIQKIKLHSVDTATDYYRADPGNIFTFVSLQHKYP